MWGWRRGRLYCRKGWSAFILSLGLLTACEDSPYRFQGYVEGEFVYVSSGIAGTLDELLVKRGDTTPPNTTFFILEHQHESAEVRQATDQLHAACFQLENLRKGKREIELNVYRGQLQQALASVRLSEILWSRDEEQYKIGAVSQSQLDNSRANLDRDRGRVVETENTLLSGELPSRDDEIRAQAAQVEAAQALLAQAQWKLDQKTGSAPQGGFIFDTLYRVGEWVEAGHPVVSLLPPENIKVRFFIPERDLARVRVGDPISIRIDSVQAPVALHVTYISPQAEFTPPVIYSNETRAKLVYMVEARPSLQDAPRLHPGQPIEVALYE